VAHVRHGGLHDSPSCEERLICESFCSKRNRSGSSTRICVLLGINLRSNRAGSG
jgi:hypothetical protein